MKDYAVVVTKTEIVYVNAETEERAIEMVKANLPPRTVTTIQVAEEVVLEETN